MWNQQVNHPKRVSRTVKNAAIGGSRKRLKKAFYLPTVRPSESYRSSDGAPSDGGGPKMWGLRIGAPGHVVLEKL